VIHLFVDGLADGLQLGQRRGARLAAGGFSEEGSKIVLELTTGTKKDTAKYRDFERELTGCKPRDPVLLGTDGASRSLRTVEECFPRSLRQCCLAHKLRNRWAKVPAEHWIELMAVAWAAYTAASHKLAEILREKFVRRYEAELPAANVCFLENFATCDAHLKLSLTHRNTMYATNLHERFFGEERRRPTVIPHALGGCAVMNPMYAVPLPASASCGVKITEFEIRQLVVLRTELSKRNAAGHVPATQPINPTYGHQHSNRE